MSPEISLTNGGVALVDHEDYDALVQYTWGRSSQHQITYARRKVGPRENARVVFMHQQVLGYENGTDWPRVKIIHLNGDGLDNRRANLREATSIEASWNAPKHNLFNGAPTSSRYKGVCRHHGKWQARISYHGQRKSLGHYDSEEEAALAYDKAAIEHFGEFARLNFPPSEYPGKT